MQTRESSSSATISQDFSHTTPCKNLVDLKNHWENVYETKTDSQTSWFQQIPETSLHLIEKFATNIDGNKTFVDVGCGNSHLTYELIKRDNVSFGKYVLIDISKAALERSSELMKDLNGFERVSFIESNILELDSVLTENEAIDIWHDRATFHFLNSVEEQVQYLKIMSKLLKKEGFFLISTFSSNGGPTKCSGLPITQYSIEKWMKMFENVESKFELVESFEQVHTTPFNTTQNFLFCIFKKVK